MYSCRIPVSESIVVDINITSQINGEFIILRYTCFETVTNHFILDTGVESRDNNIFIHNQFTSQTI